MDVMIDLETMGTNATAPVLAIGAVAFDRNTGELHESLYLGIEVSSALKGRDLSGDTLKWWMKQDDKARKDAMSGTTPTHEALISLTMYLQDVKSKHGSYKVWGNGSSFDITILENLFQQYKMKVPWNFWDVRDCRTVEDLSNIKRSSIKRSGTHHNALDDAKYQAQYITLMLQDLK